MLLHLPYFRFSFNMLGNLVSELIEDENVEVKSEKGIHRITVINITFGSLGRGQEPKGLHTTVRLHSFK